MKRNELLDRMIDHAEGTLSAEQAAELDALLDRSPGLREEMRTIRAAFAHLNSAPQDTVPDRYFSDFLPRLHERLVKSSAGFRWSLPSFTEWLVRPVLTAAGILLFVTAYSSFDPQPASSPLYDVVKEFAQEELTAVVNDPSVIITGNEEGSSELTLESGVFGDDDAQVQTENDLSSLLEEQELEQVVKQLETRTIQ
jgi:anti-sigma-K factor RskA